MAVPFSNRSIIQLGFPPVLHELAEYAMGETARLALLHAADNPDAIEFFVRAEDIARETALVTDWRLFMATTQFNPPTGIPDATAAIAKVRLEGGVLDGGELAALALCVSRWSAVRTAIAESARDQRQRRDAADLGTALAKVFDDLDIPGELGREISQVVDDEGVLKEQNIPELRAIRARMRTIQSDLEQTAAKLIERDAGSFSTNQATVRDGRTVLPVNANFRGKVGGIVHEVSASGSTLFVEPTEMVQRNNELVQAQNDYVRARQALFRRLSRSAHEHYDRLVTFLKQSTEIDVAFAKGRFSYLRGCSTVETADHGVVLRQARHPQLGVKAVPIDIELDAATRVLIITGPNTGGKTVALKTLGLLVLMRQFAMEIPADSRSALQCFDQIFVDIGDEQSMEQSLSTFSAHMANVAGIVAHADSRSLVLLDELGSGTDPEEGVALSQAILEHLIAVNALTIITTHHSALKNYGFTRDGVRNGSMEFNDQSLSPTYRVILDVPGASHAIDIAQRLGLPAAIIAAARSFLAGGETDVGRIIRDLTQSQQTLHRRLRETEETRRAVDADRERLDDRERTLAQRELSIKRRDLSAENRRLAEMRKSIELLIHDVRTRLDPAVTTGVAVDVTDVADAAGRALTLTTQLQAEIDHQRQDAERRSAAFSVPDATQVRVGDQVVIGDPEHTVSVVRVLPNGNFQVQAGSMRVHIKSHDIRKLVRPPAATPADGPRRLSSVGKPQVSVETNAPPQFSMDLRGQRLAPAITAVTRQIDLALVAGYGAFAIIHGKGTGALQKGIWDYLATAPGVHSYAFARPEDGGSGKTIVVLA